MNKIFEYICILYAYILYRIIIGERKLEMKFKNSHVQQSNLEQVPGNREKLGADGMPRKYL